MVSLPGTASESGFCAKTGKQKKIASKGNSDLIVIVVAKVTHLRQKRCGEQVLSPVRRKYSSKDLERLIEFLHRQNAR